MAKNKIERIDQEIAKTREKIAEQLECKVGTVKSRLARGRELLKAYLVGLDRAPKP